MKELILNYLNKNYRFSYDMFIKNRRTNETLAINELFNNLKKIFSINDINLLDTVYNEWCNQQEILLNNRMVEMQEKLYQQGIEIKVTEADVLRSMEDDYLKNLY